ncbi:MAG: SCO family protein [Chloroflexi bacterium CFX4]|nr:SCO family protein [Chloroflexi bacterium CFX4]MDL1923933.1 SCO family protein [Chloroflexi bacterium CFX3]
MPRLLFMCVCLCLVGCTALQAEPTTALETDHSAHATAEGYATHSSQYHGDVVLPPRFVQDFRLPATFAPQGALSDLNGYWRMIFFGYLHCPDFCPLTLVDFKLTHEQLGETAEQVRFIYITIDETRDSTEALRRYLANFHPDFVGFVGDPQTLARIQPDYGFYYAIRLDDAPQALLTVEHSARSYLVDPYGRLHASFAYHTHPSAMAEAIRWHIAQDGRDTCE